MRICYIRHANDKFGNDVDMKGDAGLTRAGRKLLKQSIEYYDSENAVAIYTSPNKRALQTAQIIQKRYNIPLYVMDGLRERIKFDYKLGTTDESEFWDNYLDYSYKTDKFETCKQYLDRNFKVFDEIIKRHDSLNENVIIVGHSATLYALNTYFNGVPKDNKIIWMQCGNCSMIKFETHNSPKIK